MAEVQVYDKQGVDDAIGAVSTVVADHETRIAALEAAGGPAPEPVVPAVSVVAVAAVVNEATPTAYFDINLDRPTTRIVTVRGRTVGLSASAGADFEGVDEDFPVPIGATALRVGVQIINDQAIESRESLKFVISDPRGCVIAVAEAVIEIESDDVLIPPDPGPVDPNAFLSIGTTPYASMQAAFNAVPINGIINLHYNGGIHLGSKTFGANNKPCTVRAIPGPNGEKPKIVGGIFEQLANGDIILKSGNWVSKSIINPMARLALEGFTIAGARKNDPNGNGAGLWVEPATPFLRLYEMIVEDCQTSCLTPTDAQSLVVEYERVLTQRCGNGGYAHNIYIGRAGEFRAYQSTFKSNTGGHPFKSRANRCILTEVTVLNDTQGRALDIPDGGYLRIVKGLYRKSPSVGMGELIGFKRESQNDGQGRVHDARADGAILENQKSVGYVVYNSAPTPFVLAGCPMPGLKTTAGPVTII